MNAWIDRIENLDVSLFAAIPSQTSPGDRRSLLAVQRATADRYKAYVYLEIGSHLGGSIQPHLADRRCRRIYSIDARPLQQPDDRSPGYVARYDDNSTARMLTLLGGTGAGDLAKIECFDFDAAEIDPRRIVCKPHIAFIDGEHTQAAVMSDFRFCREVIREGGTILFHDFSIVYPEILRICRELNRQHVAHVPLKLEDEVFGIFFDPAVVDRDPYLLSLYRKNRKVMLGVRVKNWLRERLPAPLLKALRGTRNGLPKRTAVHNETSDGGPSVPLRRG
ncbi:MAG TPA: class I SAM-dependent methyltransferase [Syntrophales bacterium]|nr:class I SAM-dependent methyltransferase [Syntrophales bacterium]